MAEKIMVSFCGWCECNPEKVNFIYTGRDKNVKEYITGREWLLLTPCEDEGTIGPYRDDYMLESCVEAQATALEGEYEDVHVEVEKE